MRNKFKYTIGIELTGIPKVPFDNPVERGQPPHTYMTVDYDRGERFDKKICKDLERKLGGKSGRDIYSGYGWGHVDSHCFEVSSPILYNKDETRYWFLNVRRIMKKHGLKPHHDDVVCGGGHIHIGIGQAIRKRKITRQVHTDYFLPWVFSQPDEEESCDNDLFDRPCWSKSSSVYSRYKTLELRFFESAKNWPEQWDHIEFALKYVAWIERRRMINKPIKMSIAEINIITKKQAIHDFKVLLKKLKLPYSRYAKYVNRNLKPRWELDRARR